MAELMREGIELVKQLEEDIKKLDGKCFEPAMEEFKHRAKLRYVENGNHLVLIKGSIIKLPEKTYTNESELHFYNYVEYRIKSLYKDGDLKDIGNREYKVVGHVSSGSPSFLATYVKGKIVDGWEFFEGLDKIEDVLLKNIM